MKKRSGALAVLILLCLVLSGFNPSALARAESANAPAKEAEARIRDGITLVYSDGTEASYSLEEMHAALGDTAGFLLRGSLLDALADIDLTAVYDVLDFSVLNGAVKAIVPLTAEQVAAVESTLQQSGLFRQLFPPLNPDAFHIAPSPDGRYEVQFRLTSSPGSGSADEKMTRRYMAGRDKALEIVAAMPSSCDSDYRKVEYLYNYLTAHVKYYHTGNGDDYWNSGEDICLLYDTLVENETVCAGYAYSLAYLCELAGIHAQYVVTGTGNYDDGTHEVVIAEVEGQNHWFDATWDAGRNQIGFLYFGLSDRIFEERSTYSVTIIPRVVYPFCESSLVNPTGYWDFSSMTYCPLRPENITDTGTGDRTGEKTGPLKITGIYAGRYSIATALNSGKVLEIGGYATENGGNAQIYDNGSIAFQQFDVCLETGGNFVLQNCGSSLLLDVQGGYAVPGTNVWQYENNSTDAQRWQIIKAGDGYFYIRSALGELYLEVADSSTDNCANVQVASFTGKDNQKWSFTLAEELTDPVSRAFYESMFGQ